MTETQIGRRAALFLAALRAKMKTRNKSTPQNLGRDRPKTSILLNDSPDPPRDRPGEGEPRTIVVLKKVSAQLCILQNKLKNKQTKKVLSDACPRRQTAIITTPIGGDATTKQEASPSINLQLQRPTKNVAQIKKKERESEREQIHHSTFKPCKGAPGNPKGQQHLLMKS